MMGVPQEERKLIIWQAPVGNRHEAEASRCSSSSRSTRLRNARCRLSGTG